MFRKLAYVSFALLVAGGVSLALAHTKSAHGPDPSYTGAPPVASKIGELNCTWCHTPSNGNNLNTPGGAVEILGLPKSYEAGRTYTLTVRLHSDSTVADTGRKWGFEMTAVRASDGAGSGIFLLPNGDSLDIRPGELAPFLSRSYVEHTDFGTRVSLGGPVTWTFD